MIDSIKKTIEEIPDEGLRLAAVATIADQFLAEYRDKKEIPPLLKPQEVTNE